MYLLEVYSLDGLHPLLIDFLNHMKTIYKDYEQLFVVYKHFCGQDITDLMAFPVMGFCAKLPIMNCKAIFDKIFLAKQHIFSVSRDAVFIHVRLNEPLEGGK